LKKPQASTVEVLEKPAEENAQSKWQIESEDVDRSPLHGLWSLTHRDLKKWYKQPIQLFLTIIQPVFWLALFGQSFNFGGMIGGPAGSQFTQHIFGTTNYQSYLGVGMMTFVIIFTSMFSGMSIVWDRRFGFLDKVLSTPVARGTIVMGKVLSSVIRCLIQAAIVLVIAIALGLNLAHLSILGLIATFVGLFLLSFGLSSLFVMIALRSTNWQTQMAVMNLLNLPLLFASNTILPVSGMPAWLQLIARVNPVTYATDLGRQLLLGATPLNSPLFDLSYLMGFAVLFSVVGIVMSWKLLTR
jgi:ABC-2 type transport system permease protein